MRVVEVTLLVLMVVLPLAPYAQLVTNVMVLTADQAVLVARHGLMLDTPSAIP
jgi:hypothetical protein